MTHSEQLTIYNYPDLRPIITEPGDMQVVAQSLSHTPEMAEQRRRIQLEAMESGIPGFIADGSLPRDSASAYLAATNPSLTSLQDPEARQMVGYYQHQPVALIEYGNSRHQRYQARGDQALDRRDAHIEDFSIVKSPDAPSGYLLGVGAAMIHALTLDAKNTTALRMRIADPQMVAFRAMLTQLGMLGRVGEVGYHPGDGMYRGLTPEESQRFGRTLVTVPRLVARRTLEDKFPALLSARQAPQPPQ